MSYIQNGASFIMCLNYIFKIYHPHIFGLIYFISDSFYCSIDLKIHHVFGVLSMGELIYNLENQSMYLLYTRVEYSTLCLILDYYISNFYLHFFSFKTPIFKIRLYKIFIVYIILLNELLSNLYSNNSPYLSCEEKYVDNGYPHTNILYDLLQILFTNLEPTYIVECGSMLGGSAIRMAETLKKTINPQK